MQRITYGEAIASFLAICSLVQIPVDKKEFLTATFNDPELVELITQSIKEDFCMNDLMCGADTIEMSELKIKRISEVLKRACFTLRKWKANDIELLTDIPKSDREMQPIEPSVRLVMASNLQ